MTEYEASTGMVMTVTGPILPESLGVTLPHEHIVSAFGAEPAWNTEYPEPDVLAVVLPYLAKLKSLGCQTVFECTAAYFGRHPALLQRISQASGMQIVTNTGYYAASMARYVPEHAYSESAAQISERWSKEWQGGIDNTGIRPGFIKTAVGDGPLAGISRKLIEAAILTHKPTGLTIQTHLGDNAGAAQEIMDLLAAESVHPSAWVWVHAHSLPAVEPLLQAASAGAWISLDGLNAERAGDILAKLVVFREQGLLNHVLLSHDGNTYNQGKFRPFEYLLTDFTRQCLAAGFTPLEVERLTVKNPAKAFTIGVKSRL